MMYCQKISMFMTLMPFCKLAIISEPTNAPKIVPSPPIVLVPPRMHDAIANSS